jgi:hypothetical protein
MNRYGLLRGSRVHPATAQLHRRRRICLSVGRQAVPEQGTSRWWLITTGVTVGLQRRIRALRCSPVLQDCCTDGARDNCD